jgi:hypothetical protein
MRHLTTGVRSNRSIDSDCRGRRRLRHSCSSVAGPLQPWASSSMPLVIRRAVELDAAALIGLRRLLFSETENMLWEPDEFVQTAEDEAKQ